MRGSPPRGQTWGNSFVRDDSLKVQKGKWTCVEVMVKMNDVGDSNGEMALWLDGKPISHLGKGFPKGKWVFDKFSRIRAARVSAGISRRAIARISKPPPAASPSKDSAGGRPKNWM
jgi:hypothetical protein